MRKRSRGSFKQHDTFFSLNLKVEHLRGKAHLKALIAEINADNVVANTKPQNNALELILLNAIYFNYRPLIISLNNNDYNAGSRYNVSGVGIHAFRTVYENLERHRLVYTRYAAFPSAYAPERTVIEVASLRKYCLSHQAQILQYIRDKEELVVLRKTAPTGRKRKIPCEYKDTDYSRKTRSLLKRYNQWIAEPEITFDIKRANQERLFSLPKFRGYTSEQIQAYVFTYFQNRNLRRIFNAPEDYNPRIAKPLPRLGGRFYGSFWQDGMPSECRKYLIVNGEPCVELDFRAMNVTMLYFQKRQRPWEVYPYDSIPVPGFEGEMFPKQLVKPFFTWCLNVESKAKAIRTLSAKLPETLEHEETEIRSFLKNHNLTYSAFIDAMLESHPVIADEFFTGEPTGLKLQYHDSEIMARILEHCMELNIYCFPIHDALLVPIGAVDYVKEMMTDTLCKYFKSEFSEEYPELLIKEG